MIVLQLLIICSQSFWSKSLRIILVAPSATSSNDHKHCGGVGDPCSSLSYAIENRSSDNDTIILDTGNATRFTYMIDVPVEVRCNITIKGKNSDSVEIIFSKQMSYTDVLFRVRSKRITLEDVALRHFAMMFELLADETEVTLKKCKVESFLTLFLQNARRHSLTLLHCEFYNFNYACRHTHQSRLRVENSSFVGSVSKHNATKTYSNSSIVLKQIGIHIPYAKYVSIKTSVFENISFAMKLGRSAWGFNVRIANCSFVGNYFRVWHTGVAVNDIVSPLHVSGAGSLHLSDSLFANNVAVSGGAVSVSHNVDWHGRERSVDGIPLYVSIEGTIFVNNTASNQGGALSGSLITSGKVAINKCLFVRNSVNPRVGGDFANIVGADLGRGGAINMNRVHLIVNGSTFIDNSAPLFGGTLFYERRDTDMKPMVDESILANSIINGSSQNLAIFGSSLYASGNMALSNVTINSIASHGLTSVLYYEKTNLGSSLEPSVKRLHVKCPPNNKITTTKHKVLDQYYLLVYMCVPCEKGSYNLDYESEHVYLRGTVQQKTIKCHLCPTGGSCESGIVSRDNFWGHSDPRGLIHFMPCPEMYCCSQYGEKCTNFSGCATNREDVLCGRCRDGFTEDMLSTSCVPNESCDLNLFWSMFVVVVLSYTAFIVYYKEIINSVQNGKRSVYNQFKDVLTAGNVLATPRGEVNTTGEGFSSGLLSVIVMYYQVELILKVKTTTKKHYKISWLWTDFVSSLFNFKPSVVVTHHLCAWTNMDAVGKEFVKLSLIYSIFLLLFLFCICEQLWRNFNDNRLQTADTRCCIPNKDLQNHKVGDKHVSETLSDTRMGHVPLHLRIKCAFLRLLLLTYIPVVTVMLKLLHCVPIGQKKHLFISGHHLCYTRWQYIIAVVFVIWIAPFCVCLYYAIDNLKRKKISLQEFFYSLVFPPMTIFFLWRNRSPRETTPTKEEKEELSVSHDESHLLMVFSEPYRSVTEKWVGVLVFRKLCLSLTSVLVVNPVVRLYTMLFLLVIFLIDHIRVQPYKNNTLNWLETICLSLLVLSSSINLFWAHSFISDITNMSMLRNVGEVFLYSELLLVLGFPFAVAFFMLLSVCFVGVFYCKKFTRR